MDITKVTADILDGPNWGTWAVQIQAAARVLNCWSVMKGERIAGVTPPTYDLLLKPVHGNAAGQIYDRLQLRFCNIIDVVEILAGGVLV